MGMAVRGGGTTGSVGVGIPGSLPEALGRCQEKCVIKYSDIAAASGCGINHLRRWRATASVQLHGPLARAGRAFSPYRLIARLAQGLSRVECDGAMSGGLDSVWDSWRARSKTAIAKRSAWPMPCREISVVVRFSWPMIRLM